MKELTKVSEVTSMNYQLEITQEWINGTDKETEIAGENKEFFLFSWFFSVLLRNN